ncbi:MULTISPECIES: hypothetical protein [Burkholderiaceae]|uniref:hypothetical protein n=1 Tax=Burkholderiaceae TaxID=119060 RepID=UPI0009761160|nr:MULTISPECIES: hypothetical protein [Burkholderiaceae]MCG1018431.1 hypothetical protein [Mycetohabitans sp. B4]MCG1039299.1 hypothetical protein [Mycetohabitans sp. B7]
MMKAFIPLPLPFTPGVDAAGTVIAHGRNVLEAGGILTTVLTAWQALHDHGNLRAGQKVLIHGAVGSVGGAAVQVAKIAGAGVVAMALARNLEYVKSGCIDGYRLCRG